MDNPTKVVDNIKAIDDIDTPTKIIDDLDAEGRPKGYTDENGIWIPCVYSSATKPGLLDYARAMVFGVGVRAATKCPNYLRDNLVPRDDETFLTKGGYTRTKNKYKGAIVYKDKKGKYYYRDTSHTGKAAHIEVFDKSGKKHLYEMTPDGDIIPNSQDKSKKLIF